MDEFFIVNALGTYGMIPNCYTQNDNEADMFAIRKSGLCDEFEVKISRSDFLNDAKKIVQVRAPEARQPNSDNFLQDLAFQQQYPNWYKEAKLVAPWQKLKYDALRKGEMATNNFWYAVPSDLVSTDEIPDFAGLIYVEESGVLRIIKHPVKLHNRKLTDCQKYKYAKKLAYRFWDYRLGKRV